MFFTYEDKKKEFTKYCKILYGYGGTTKVLNEFMTKFIMSKREYFKKNPHLITE